MITHKACLITNYATLMLKCKQYGYHDAAFHVMNSTYERKLGFLHDTVLFHNLH